MSSHTKDGAFSIQQVADMTGLSKQLIRKWEERYELIQPKRLDNGYRIYNENDIKILLKVKLLSEQGYSIKQASMLISKEDSSLDVKMDDYVIFTPKIEEMNQYVLELLQEGTNGNEQGINLILQHAYNQLGLEKFIKAVIIPFLKEVGYRWEKRQWDEYQEALSSLVVRDFLIPIRRNFHLKEDAPLVLGACLPEEQHEVPVHLLLVQIMLKGWQTHFLN